MKMLWPLLALYGLAIGGLAVMLRFTADMSKIPAEAPIKQVWGLPLAILALAIGVWALYKTIKG